MFLLSKLLLVLEAEMWGRDGRATAANSLLQGLSDRPVPTLGSQPWFAVLTVKMSRPGRSQRPHNEPFLSKTLHKPLAV